MTEHQRVLLALEVFDKAFDSLESFHEDHFGADLAYLMGAILGEGRCVQWPDSARTRALFKEWFPPEHAVWNYIRPLP